MLKRAFVALVLTAGLATTAVAQVSSPGGLGNSGSSSGSQPSFQPDAGLKREHSINTDPGITNSTRGSGGGVDLYNGGNTINPGGVNPDLHSLPGCAGANDSADSGVGQNGCAQ